MAKIPVRFMQGGGNDVSSKPEEKKMNVISTGYGDIDADAFKAFISDPRNFQGIYDRYKGFDGSKIREAVTSRLLEMANSFIKGDMKFDDSTINKYLSNNHSFASDGKTKKRIFTGNYSHKDQNTINSLAARVMLDVINDNIKATSGKKAEMEKANEEARKKAEEEKSKLKIYDPEAALWDSKSDKNGMLLTGNIEGNRKDILAMINRDLKKLEDQDFIKGYTPESIEKAKIYYNDLAKYLSDDRILSDEDYIRTFKINNPNIHRMLNWKQEEQPVQDPNAGLTPEQIALNKAEADMKVQESMKSKRDYLISTTRTNDFNNWWSTYSKIPDYSGGFRPFDIPLKPINSGKKEYDTWYSYVLGNMGDERFNESFRKLIDNYYRTGYGNFNDLSYKNDETGEVIYTPTINDVFGLFDIAYKINPNIGGSAVISSPDQNGEVMVYINRNGKKQIVKMNFPQAVRNGLYEGKDVEGIRTRMFNSQFPEESYYVDENAVVHSPYFEYMKKIQDEAAAKQQQQNGEQGTESMRNGGIVRFQQGGLIDYSDFYIPGGSTAPSNNLDAYYTPDQIKTRDEFINRRNVAKASADMRKRHAMDKAGNDKEKAKIALSDQEFGKDDWFRLGSALANIVSSITAVSGFTPLSSGISVLGTAMSTAADIADDSVSGWQAAKNAALNFGLDAFSLIPYAGLTANASKTAKAIKTASNLLAVGSTALAAAGLGEDAQLVSNALKTGKWSNQDATALANIISTIAKGVTMGKTAKTRFHTSSDMKGGQKQYAVRVSSKNLSGNKNKIVLDEKELKKLDGMRFDNGKPIDPELALNKQKEYITSEFDVKMEDLDFNTPIKFTNNTNGLFKGARNYFGTSGRVYERNSFSPLNNPNNTGRYGLKTGDSWMGEFNQKPFFPFYKKYNPTDVSRYTRKDYVRKRDNSISNTRMQGEVERQLFDPELESLKNGGRIKRVKLKNGGHVYKFQEGGGQWANGRPRGTYYDDGANYFDIWYNTTGKALEDRLAKMLELKKAGKIEEWNAARKGIMKSSRDIQSSYKGMNKQTGWGFNNTGYTPVADITKQHQEAFDKDFRPANEKIWAYQGIHRRGNTGDNETSDNKYEGINSVYTSMRTYGYTNDNQAQFEGDERFKRIQQLANENNLVYEPWKDIAEGKENWYVFNERPQEVKVVETPEWTDPELNDTDPQLEPVYRTTPARVDEKRQTTEPGNSSPIFGDLLSAAILAGTLGANKKAFYQLDTPLLSHPLYNAKIYDGYYEKDIANKEANKVRLAGRRFGAETADIDRYTANSLAGESMASELERKAGVESANKYDQTTEKAINTFNTNATMSADTFNRNISAITNTRNANKQLRGNYITAQWEGAWKPYLNEIKGNWLQNQRERQAMDQERFMKTDYADYLRSSWEKAYDEAKITDPNNRNQQYLFENNRNIYDKYNRLNTNYYYTNAPIYKQRYPLMMFRGGGKVTTKITKKTDGDSFMKEFGKNDREAKKDFTKRFINLSTGALSLHSASRKDRLELYKYLKNLK